MSTEDDRKQEKRNRLARKKPEARPVASVFITPAATAEPQVIWNVRLPESLNLRMRKALVDRAAARGKRFTAREATIEALEAWLQDADSPSGAARNHD